MCVVFLPATHKRGGRLDRVIYLLLRFTVLERVQEQGVGHYFVPRYTRNVDKTESKHDYQAEAELLKIIRSIKVLLIYFLSELGILQINV